jgi:hypothetical protein
MKTEEKTVKELHSIIGDLQERNSMMRQCLEDISNSSNHETAVKDAEQLLEAEAAVDMVQDRIIPRIPMWIGVQIPTNFGYYKICVGINQEDGNEVSFCNETDVQLGKEQGYDCWNVEGNIVIKYGTDAEVFDENHELIE